MFEHIFQIFQGFELTPFSRCVAAVISSALLWQLGSNVIWESESIKVFFMSLDLPVGWHKWPETLLLSLMKDLSQRRTNVCLEVTIKLFIRENDALFPSKPSPLSLILRFTTQKSYWHGYKKLYIAKNK